MKQLTNLKPSTKKKPSADEAQVVWAVCVGLAMLVAAFLQSNTSSTQESVKTNPTNYPTNHQRQIATPAERLSP